MSDLISRQAAIDAIHEDADWLAAQGSDWQVERMERDKSILKSLPTVQPKGTKLSTVCLLCKKPAVTFNTEDDIPYTNYSYCEDCLRKGLKLLKAQNKILPPVQPNHNAEVSKMEIIHCKDCIRFKKPSALVDADWGWCSGWHMPPAVTFVKGDGFCYRAEKKGEEK